MNLTPIGTIKSPYKTKKAAPSQGAYFQDESTLELSPKYEQGLKGVSNLKYIVVLYWQHQSDRTRLQAKPPFADQEYGVFATRSPNRPNPIGLCVCKVISLTENKIKVIGLDALDNSPILDIKVYSQKIDTSELFTENGD